MQSSAKKQKKSSKENVHNYENVHVKWQRYVHIYRSLSIIRPWAMNLESAQEGDGRIFEDPSPENRPTLDSKVGPPNSKVGPPKYMRTIRVQYCNSHSSKA